MKKMLVHYLILLGILAAGTCMFFIVGTNMFLQLCIGISTAVLYVFWGIVYHSMQKDLHRKIVIEYLLIGAISIVLLVTMLGF